MLTSNKLTIFFLFTLVSALQADITITVDKLQVKLSPRRCWAVTEIKRNGFMICDGFDSAQGSVLLIDGAWAGSGHGNEQILDAFVIVDGSKQLLRDTQSYTGDIVLFYRRTALDNAYILNSTMTITQERIDEDVSLQGYNETKTCDVFYGFLGSRANRLTDYVAFGLDGSILKTGRTNRNDNKETFLRSAIAVGQYDPIAKDCALTVSSYGEEWGLMYSIWDRPSDNKLYSNFLNAGGACSLSNFFQIGQSILFFNSSQANWQNNALSLLKSVRCSQQMPGDLNKDCKVDFVDFAIFADWWLSRTD